MQRKNLKYCSTRNTELSIGKMHSFDWSLVNGFRQLDVWWTTLQLALCKDCIFWFWMSYSAHICDFCSNWVWLVQQKRLWSTVIPICWCSWPIGQYSNLLHILRPLLIRHRIQFQTDTWPSIQWNHNRKMKEKLSRFILAYDKFPWFFFFFSSLKKRNTNLAHICNRMHSQSKNEGKAIYWNV